MQELERGSLQKRISFYRGGLIGTALGRRTMARAPGPAEGVLPEAIAELSPAALRGLDRGLKQIVAALNVRDDAAAERPLADL